MKINYGIDAPLVPILYFIIGISIIGINYSGDRTPGTYLSMLVGVIAIAGGCIFLHTTLRGKLTIWHHLLANEKIDPHSQVLDLGCGHGAVLIALAKRLEQPGMAVGVDLWHQQDQAGNSAERTQQNLAIAQVADRTKLVTADISQLPFEDAQYSLVTTSFVLHNLKPVSKRQQALKEAVRVMRPGARLLIVDTGHHFKEYQTVLSELGMIDLKQSKAGFNGWWTGPWMASSCLTATKPE